MMTSILRTPSETEIAWFAGLIDGEGCIQIRSVKRKHFNPQYCARLSICMTHLPTLERVQTIWNAGSIRPHKVYNEAWKAKWRWLIEGPRLMKIFILSYPYLETKKAEALVAIRLQQRVSRSKKTWGNTLPSIECLRRKLLVELCKKLKNDIQLSQNIEQEIDSILKEHTLAPEVDRF